MCFMYVCVNLLDLSTSLLNVATPKAPFKKFQENGKKQGLRPLLVMRALIYGICVAHLL